jgi:hypothetical protein
MEFIKEGLPFIFKVGILLKLDFILPLCLLEDSFNLLDVSCDFFKLKLDALMIDLLLL